MATTEKWAGLGTETTLISAATVANNANNLSADYNNTVGNTGDGYTAMRVKASIQMATGGTANTAMSVWFLKSSDNGVTFEAGDATPYTPSRMPDLIFPIPVPNDTTARISARDVMAPAGHFKVLARNEGTGVSMTLTLTVTPITRQSV